MRFALLVLCAQELSTLPQTSSLSLFLAGRNNIHHPLPSAPASHTQERDFSTIFSNFQTLLAAFFPTTVHTDKTFEKTLAIWKMSPVLPREREVWLSRRSVASLCVYSVQWAAVKQRIQLAVTQQNRQ